MRGCRGPASGRVTDTSAVGGCAGSASLTEVPREEPGCWGERERGGGSARRASPRCGLSRPSGSASAPVDLERTRHEACAERPFALGAEPVGAAHARRCAAGAGECRPPPRGLQRPLGSGPRCPAEARPVPALWDPPPKQQTPRPGHPGALPVRGPGQPGRTPPAVTPGPHARPGPGLRGDPSVGGELAEQYRAGEAVRDAEAGPTFPCGARPPGSQRSRRPAGPGPSAADRLSLEPHASATREDCRHQRWSLSHLAVTSPVLWS